MIGEYNTCSYLNFLGQIIKNHSKRKGKSKAAGSFPSRVS